MMIIPASVDPGLARALEAFRGQLECERKGEEGDDDDGREAEGLKMEARDKGHGDDASSEASPARYPTEPRDLDDG